MRKPHCKCASQSDAQASLILHACDCSERSGDKHACDAHFYDTNTGGNLLQDLKSYSDSDHSQNDGKRNCSLDSDRRQDDGKRNYSLDSDRRQDDGKRNCSLDSDHSQKEDYRSME